MGVADAPDDANRAGETAERPRYQMSISERVLLGRLVKRDEDAFNHVVRSYGDRVYNLILRLVG